MKENNPKRYRIEGEGEWGIADGLIYDNVVFEGFDPEELRKTDGIISAFGLDFGYTDPNAFVCCLIDNRQAVIYIFDEWYKNGVTNKIIAQTIKNMGYGGRDIICDCAESKSIRELREEGIHAIPSQKGADSVRHGIQLIQNYKIVVHPRCREFKKEILNYCWGKTSDGRMSDKPEHDFSHGMDAMRYAVTKALRQPGFSFD